MHEINMAILFYQLARISFLQLISTEHSCKTENFEEFGTINSNGRITHDFTDNHKSKCEQTCA